MIHPRALRTPLALCISSQMVKGEKTEPPFLNSLLLHPFLFMDTYLKSAGDCFVIVINLPSAQTSTVIPYCLRERACFYGQWGYLLDYVWLACSVVIPSPSLAEWTRRLRIETDECRRLICYPFVRRISFRGLCRWCTFASLRLLPSSWLQARHTMHSRILNLVSLCWWSRKIWDTFMRMHIWRCLWLESSSPEANMCFGHARAARISKLSKKKKKSKTLKGKKKGRFTTIESCHCSRLTLFVNPIRRTCVHSCMRSNKFGSRTWRLRFQSTVNFILPTLWSYVDI